MAEFICRLGTPAGEVVTRTIEAVGAQEARVRLESEGFRVFAVTPPKTMGVAALTRRGGKGTHARFKANDFLLFNQQLAALLRAGIPILQAISMLRKRAQSGLGTVLADVEDKIRGGLALSAAFAAQGAIFPRIYTASILAGERSGALDEVLDRYVNYMRRSVNLRRKIRGALAYPTLLLLASMGMVAFLTVYVVPRMSSLFEGFGRNKLPWLTLIVTGISTWLTVNFWWLVPLSIVALIALVFWSRTPSGRLTVDRTVLKLPLIGKLLQQVAVAQATRSLATLLAGGITLVESWEIAAESITNRELRRRSSAILPMIREGRSFTESLESAGWFPELAIDMIGVGERSGSLREMLDEVSGFYDSEAEVKLEQLTTTIEPAILIVMGGVVVTILLSIYLPIISAISNASSGR
jgi:type IV pilus assembly protein PilC